MISLTPEVQRVPANVLRRGRDSAFKGRCLVEMSPHADEITVCKQFVSGGEQNTSLAGYAKIAPGDVIGFAQAMLVEILMCDASPWNTSDDSFASNAIEGMSGVTPHENESGDLPASSGRDTGETDEVKASPSALLSRLDPDQQIALLD